MTVKHRFSRRSIIIAVVVLAGVAVVLVCLFWLLSGNSGTIKHASSSQQNQKSITYKDFSGQNIHFTYPDTYFVHQLTAKDNDLELYQLDADTLYTKQLAISVSRLPDGTINSSSAYLLRKARSDLYTERTVTLNNQKISIWVSHDGHEQTVFMTQAGKLATFAFTQGSGDLSSLTAEVDTLVQSFGWNGGTN